MMDRRWNIVCNHKICLVTFTNEDCPILKIVRKIFSIHVDS